MQGSWMQRTSDVSKARLEMRRLWKSSDLPVETMSHHWGFLGVHSWLSSINVNMLPPTQITNLTILMRVTHDLSMSHDYILLHALQEVYSSNQLCQSFQPMTNERRLLETSAFHLKNTEELVHSFNFSRSDYCHIRYGLSPH